MIEQSEFDLASEPDMFPKSKKGVMRKLYAEIHKKLTVGGWTADDMVLWLERRKIKMTVGQFRVCLYELDREHGFNRRRKTKLRVDVPVMKTNSVSAAIESSREVEPGNSTNPLRVLTGNKRSGDFNPVPQAVIEIDQSSKTERS